MKQWPLASMWMVQKHCFWYILLIHSFYVYFPVKTVLINKMDNGLYLKFILSPFCLWYQQVYLDLYYYISHLTSYYYNNNLIPYGAQQKLQMAGQHSWQCVAIRQSVARYVPALLPPQCSPRICAYMWQNGWNWTICLCTILSDLIGKEI